MQVGQLVSFDRPQKTLGRKKALNIERYRQATKDNSHNTRKCTKHAATDTIRGIRGTLLTKRGEKRSHPL